MANTIKQAGAQSATIAVPADGENFGFATAVDWAALPAGKLKSLLNRAYTSGSPAVPDFSLFFDAAAEAGFTSQALTKNVAPGTGAHTDIVSWDLGPDGYPIATVITVDPAAEYQLRLVTSYSASE